MATPRASKKDAIIAAAAELFRLQGVHATSVADIVAASHSSAGSLYHHFASKDDVVLAVAQAGVWQPLQGALLRQGDDQLDPASVLAEIVGATERGDIQSGLIVQLWAGAARDPQLMALLRTAVDGLRAEAVTRIARWLGARGVPDAEERALGLASLTISLAMGYLAQRTLNPDLDADLFVREAAALLQATPGAGLQPR